MYLYMTYMNYLNCYFYKSYYTCMRQPSQMSIVCIHDANNPTTQCPNLSQRYQGFLNMINRYYKKISRGQEFPSNIVEGVAAYRDRWQKTKVTHIYRSCARYMTCLGFHSPLTSLSLSLSKGKRRLGRQNQNHLISLSLLKTHQTLSISISSSSFIWYLN